MAVLTEGGMAVVAAIAGWLFGYPLWERIHVTLEALVQGLLITLPMLAAFFLCVYVPVGPLERIKQFIDQVVKPMFRKCTLLDLAVISFLAGLGEELLFRGLLQPMLVDWLDLWPGLLLASLLFGLAHPITPGYVVLATAVGLYLGWWANEFGNLFEVIFAHALYDFVGLVYLVRIESPARGEIEEPRTE